MGSRIGTMYIIMCFLNFKSFLKERKKVRHFIECPMTSLKLELLTFYLLEYIENFSKYVTT